MRYPRLGDSDERYWVTEKGILDLLTAPKCKCEIKLSGLLVTCQECGTVYGYLKDQALSPTSWRGKGD
jgi:hypothetical protein